MGYALGSTTVNIIEYWILILMMQYICSAHMNLTRKNIIICTLIAAAVNFSMYVTSCRYPEIMMPVLIALTVLWLSSRRGRDLLLFFPALAIYMILTIIPEGMLEELFPTFNFTPDINGIPWRIHGLATDLVLFSILILLGHILRKYETKVHLTVREVLGSIGLLFFSLIDVPLLMAVNRSNISPLYRGIWKFVFVGAFLFGVVYYLFCLAEARVRIYRQTLSRSETEYLHAQLDSLQDIKENEEKVRQLRHDLQNHLTVIQSLCEEGSYDEIKNYTAQLTDNIVLSGNKISTGNKAADLIIHSKCKTAEAHHIDFTFNGSLERLQTMEPPDICGLLANAYDNAIEACLSQESPFIRTAVSATRNYTVIQITNSVSRKVPIRGNRIATTKKDKLSHGYGIDIMKRIAQKYNGSCTLYSDSETFTVKITLLNPVADLHMA